MNGATLASHLPSCPAASCTSSFVGDACVRASGTSEHEPGRTLGLALAALATVDAMADTWGYG